MTLTNHYIQSLDSLEGNFLLALLILTMVTSPFAALTALYPLSFQGVSSFVPKVCKSEVASKSGILMDVQVRGTMKSELAAETQPKDSSVYTSNITETNQRRRFFHSSRRHATTGVWRDIRRLESNRPIRSSRKGWILLKASSVEVVCE